MLARWPPRLFPLPPFGGGEKVRYIDHERPDPSVAPDGYAPVPADLWRDYENLRPPPVQPGRVMHRFSTIGEQQGDYDRRSPWYSYPIALAGFWALMLLVGLAVAARGLGERGFHLDGDETWLLILGGIALGTLPASIASLLYLGEARRTEREMLARRRREKEAAREQARKQLEHDQGW
ncbi:MAG TPA: hypothetical protein PLS90_08670 [Candidatus Sumerlaeota bacterium]|nr:hypothetical protein [Candidatus Sumerlaeota bacterium]HOR28672.1 hypothetical protein [Candidatus Sumerlaeota bacterium]HPK02517.1 hypothetical protein [Candidatus Sumerlaeota bacterium]